MEYSVIVEQKNGIWWAVIPALADLSAEGQSCDEAVSNARRAAEEYLSKVVVTTIRINGFPQVGETYSIASDWIKSAGIFSPDDELYQQYLTELEAEKQRQREEAEREIETAAN